MKLDLSDNDFKELEKKCLLLDILVDCEEYNEFDGVIFKIIPEDIKPLVLNVNRIEEPTKGNIKESIEAMKNNKHNYVDYFSLIINSKYIRRVLAENKNRIKPDDLYKELTEKLLKKIPQCPTDANINKLRVIFLNEISASSVGYLAKGYAEMALEELKDGKWITLTDKRKKLRHPYELYALYNKGLALSHDPTPDNNEKAIETFNQILQSFRDEKSEETLDEKYSRNVFANSYTEYTDFFDLFFLLIYVPTKHLMAEVYDHLNSSLNRENTILEALTRIKNEEVKLSNEDLFDTIKKYFKAKFSIQLCLTKIDSGEYNKSIKPKNLKKDWLIAFHESRRASVISDLNTTIISLGNPLNITDKLKATEAIFWKEYASVSIGKSSKMDLYKKSYELCVKQLSNRIAPDWSDFAITFLECILNILDEDEEVLAMIFKGKNGNIWTCYEGILDIIIKEDWVQRKRELTERFLECQENILSQSGKKLKNYKQYLNYQIRLVGKILADEENRFFKKKWSEQETESLKKSLQYYVDTKGNSGHRKQLQNIHIKKENIFPDKIDLDEIGRFVGKKVNCDFYHKKWRSNSEAFYDHLIYKSCRAPLQNSYGLTVLRRWQSFTPALSSGSEVGEKGGGYFVYKTNEKGEIEEGLVIDPGFNFLENFFDEGFSIKDINAILLTHSHPDHSDDLMSVVTLVHEMNKRGKRVFSRKKWEDSKLVLFMTDGCYFKYAQLMGAKNIKSFRDIIRVEVGKSYGKEAFLEEFEVRAVKAIHDDLTDYDSVGYIINEKRANGMKGEELVGFTGDTQWYPEIEKNFQSCPVICMNIGGVVDIFKRRNITLSDLSIDKNNRNKHRDNIKEILAKENHLYFPGFYLMAESLAKSEKKPKLLILSELCEEMKGGLRTDLAEKMSDKVKIPILPEDIGLTVFLGPEESSDSKVGFVVCKACNSLKNPKVKNIVAVETNKNNAIVYLCKKHYNQLKEESILPKINELELDIDEFRKPLIK